MSEWERAEKDAAVARYFELLDIQKAERRDNPKLGMIGVDGYFPRSEITQELEEQWANAGMPRHA